MDQDTPTDVVRSIGPDIVKSSLRVGGSTAVAGAVLGGAAGLIRSSTPVLFAAASAIQCGVLGTTFWASRRSLIAYHAHEKGVPTSELNPNQRSNASFLAGGLTGATGALLFRGRMVNVVAGAVVFSVLGFMGQKGYNAMDQNRQNRREEQDGIFLRLAKSRYSPMKVMTDQEYEGMLRERQIRIEAELALIDDDIARLRRQALEDSKSTDRSTT